MTTYFQTGWQRHVGWLLLALALAPTLQAQRSVPAPSSIVDANSRFGFKVFNRLTTQTPDRNILVAPTGLSLTFALLDNGSDPETRKEIESVFEFTGVDLTEINAGCADLRKEMNLAPPTQKKQPRRGQLTSGDDNRNRLVIADFLWIKHGYFGKQFLDASRDYGVELKQWLASPSASTQVSQWASGRIHKNMSISMGTMTHNDFLLVDVTRFHSFWEDKFSAELTKPTPFTLLSGQKKSVPMMYRGAEFRYLEGPKFQAVVLPYGQNASMYVFLPAEESSLKEFEMTLTAKGWQEWLPLFGFREGMVGCQDLRPKRVSMSALYCSNLASDASSSNSRPFGLPLQFRRALDLPTLCRGRNSAWMKREPRRSVLASGLESRVELWAGYRGRNALSRSS